MCKTFAGSATGATHCAAGNKVPESVCLNFLQLKTGSHPTDSFNLMRRRVSRRRISTGDEATARCWGSGSTAADLVSYGTTAVNAALWTVCREECWKAIQMGATRRRDAKAISSSPGCVMHDCTNLQSATAATLI